MRTKAIFLRYIMMLVLSVSTAGAMAQSTADPANVCLNSLEDYWVINTPGSTYDWVLSGGGTITTGQGTDQISISWTSTGPYTLTVTETFTSTTGCEGEPVILNIIVNPLPVPVIAGPSPVCVNSTGNVYTTQSGMTDYVWNVVGGTITSGGTATDDTATITWNTTGAQSISVNYTDLAGCTAAAATVYGVTVDPLPVVTLNGPSPVCVTSTGNVYTTESGMTGYLWDVSTGGTVTAGGGINDNTVTITWNTAAPQTVSVNYTNGASCTAAAATVYDVTVDPLPVVTIVGSSDVCVNSTGNVYTTEAGMTDYQWAVSTGGTITAGGGINDNTVTITWNTAAPQTVSVNYTNGASCTAAAATVYDVTVNPSPVVTISGPTPVCVNATGNVYTTEAGMTDYLWDVSTGGTITAGGTATDNTVTVTWDTAGPQTVSVNYTNGTDCTAASPSVYNVTVNPLPVTSPIWHN